MTHIMCIKKVENLLLLFLPPVEEEGLPPVEEEGFDTVVMMILMLVSYCAIDDVTVHPSVHLLN